MSWNTWVRMMAATRVAAYRLGVLARLPWAFVRSGWRHVLFLVLVIIGALLVGALAVSDKMTGLAAERERLRNELERIEAINSEMRSENAMLARKVEALRAKRELLERQAREDLGFVRDGEVVVILPK